MPGPIITIKEARKLLGSEASSQLSDRQVEEIINQLDFLATLAIKHLRKEKKNGSG